MMGEVKNVEFPDVEASPRLFPAPSIFDVGTKRGLADGIVELYVHYSVRNSHRNNGGYFLDDKY